MENCPFDKTVDNIPFLCSIAVEHQTLAVLYFFLFLHILFFYDYFFLNKFSFLSEKRFFYLTLHREEALRYDEIQL